MLGSFLLFVGAIGLINHGYGGDNEDSQEPAQISNSVQFNHSQVLEKPSDGMVQRGYREPASIEMPMKPGQGLTLSYESKLSDECYHSFNKIACFELKEFYSLHNKMKNVQQISRTLCFTQDNFRSSCVDFVKTTTNLKDRNQAKTILMRKCNSSVESFDVEKREACRVLIEEFGSKVALQSLCREGEQEFCHQLMTIKLENKKNNKKNTETLLSEYKMNPTVSYRKYFEDLAESEYVNIQEHLGAIAYLIKRDRYDRGELAFYFNKINENLEDIHKLVNNLPPDQSEKIIATLDKASTLICSEEYPSIVRSYFCLN